MRQQTIDDLASFLAIRCEDYLAIGRAMGIGFPVKYAFGCKVTSTLGGARVRIRIDEISAERLLPMLDAHQTAIALNALVSELAHTYLDRHQEIARPSVDALKDLDVDRIHASANVARESAMFKRMWGR